MISYPHTRTLSSLKSCFNFFLLFASPSELSTATARAKRIAAGAEQKCVDAAERLRVTPDLIVFGSGFQEYRRLSGHELCTHASCCREPALLFLSFSTILIVGKSDPLPLKISTPLICVCRASISIRIFFTDVLFHLSVFHAFVGEIHQSGISTFLSAVSSHLPLIRVFPIRADIFGAHIFFSENSSTPVRMKQITSSFERWSS